MGARRWYWPRKLATWRGVEVNFAPTFVCIGAGFYPALPHRPASIVVGIWPLTLSKEFAPRPSLPPSSPTDHLSEEI